MSEKLAVISGASRGLGRSMALHLARRGVGVIGTYNNSSSEADAFAAEINSAGGKLAMLSLDVGKSADFPAFAQTVAKTLIINAAWVRPQPKELYGF